MAGLFENLPGDRTLAGAWEDSLSSPGFLGYDLDATSSSLSSGTLRVFVRARNSSDRAFSLETAMEVATD